MNRLVVRGFVMAYQLTRWREEYRKRLLGVLQPSEYGIVI